MSVQQPAGSPRLAPAVVRVDLDAVRENVAVLCQRAAGAETMAVVKADAYGHGLLPVARAALAGGASWLGVAQPEEALALRTAGITAPTLCWLFQPGSAAAALVAAGIDVSLAAPWALDETITAARAVGTPARVHLKVDTGLGRGGAAMADWDALCEATARAAAAGSVEVIGVWSHLAFADAPDHPTVRAQREVFLTALERAQVHGLKPQRRHLANSAAVLTSPQSHFDLVRPGLAVYGLSPVPDLGSSQHYGLRPAMSVSTRLALVKDVPAGQGVSYAHAYVTPRATTLGLVPVGYADGVPRHASDTAPVRVGAIDTRVAGRVCMDQFVVDLGPDAATNVRAGEEVTVFGEGVDGGPTAQDWAEAAGTISYEIVARFGTRIPRTYVGEHAAEWAQ